MQVIGLEVSTSSAKAIRYDRERGVLDEHVRPFPEDVAGSDYQEPEEMVETAVRVLRETVEHGSGDVGAIGLCGTWHSLLYLDQQGEPQGRIRTWVDTTGRSFVRQKREDAEWVDTYYRRTGCLPHAMYPFWKHCSLKEDGAFSSGEKPNISSQIEYLFQSLTGERAVSKSTASGSGFFNIHQASWDEELLSFAGVEPDQLATLADETDTAPLLDRIADRVGLPAGTPVTVGAADGGLNQLGVGGTRTDIISFSVGTSGAIRMAVNEPQLPHERSTWCYYLHDETCVAGGATHGINCLDWFIDLLNANAAEEGWDYESLDEASADMTLEDAPFFLPFLHGERAPGWNEDRTGVFAGLKATHGPGKMYHAIREGILFTLYDCYRMLVDNWQASPEKIVISGGILNSDRWTQMAADLFGSELEATGRSNDSTVGASMLALAAIDDIDHVNDLSVETSTVATPNSEERHEVYQDRYRSYRDLYSVNR